MKRKFNKYLACLMALAMALSLGAVSAFAVDSAPQYYDGTTSKLGTSATPYFFANGTPITISARPGGAAGALITWDGGSQEIAANTNVFGGAHDSDTAMTTSVTMTGGTVNAVFGGGMHKSHVTTAALTLKSGVITSQICGGGASSFENKCGCTNGSSWYAGDAKQSPCVVDKAVVTVEDGVTVNLLLFGGGEGISCTNAVDMTIEGGTFTSAWVTAGGSNGYTGAAKLTINGGSFNVVQGVNRGSMNTIAMDINGGTFEKLYIGGETGDSGVTGTYASATADIANAAITTLLPGTNGGGSDNADNLTVSTSGNVTIGNAAAAQTAFGGKLTVYATQVGDTRYTDLAAAVAAARTGETVKLLQDVTLTDTLTINTDQTVTIDLNGHDIERTQKVIVVERGNVTFAGTGTIRETTPGNGALVLKGSNDPAATGYTVVTVGENVTLEGFAGAFVTPYTSGTEPCAYGVTLNLNGKIVSKANASGGVGYGLYVNGQIQHTENYPVINVGATAQVSSVGSAIYAAGYADWRIASGAELTGVTSGIGIKSGKLTVSGGTITCTGPNTAPTEGFSNGINASGAAIQIESNSDYAGAMEISITGGSVVSQNGYSIYEYIGKTGEDTDVTKLSASGGSFQGGICISEELAGNALSKFITGGTWSVDPTDYVASGYSVRTNSDGSYTVYYPSSGGGSGSSTPIKTVEVSGEGESVQVPYKEASDGTIELVMDAETIADVLHEQTETGTVSIDLTTVEGATTAVIPAAAVGAIAEAAADPENDADGLAVLLPDAAVELDAAALASVVEQTGGKDLTIAVEPVAVKELPAEQREAVPEAAVIYDVTVHSDGVVISAFDGSIAVTVPYALQAGERAAAVSVWYLADDGSLTKMPAVYDAKTETVRFTTTHLSKYVVGYDEGFHLCAVFTDIANHWGKDSICYVVENGLFKGVSDTLFGPEESTSRAMVVTILWRLEGEPVVNYLMDYDDVAEDAWYSEAVRWASSEKLVEGYGEGRFGADDSITREQLAAILWRYAQYKGCDVSVGEETNILSYEDFADISEYAIPALQWACGAGLIEGQSEGYLAPGSDATRAETAAIFARYLA
jgi:hypothetical protein